MVSIKRTHLAFFQRLCLVFFGCFSFSIPQTAIAQMPVPLDENHLNANRPLWRALPSNIDKNTYLSMCKSSYSDFLKQRDGVYWQPSPAYVKVSTGGASWTYKLYTGRVIQNFKKLEQTKTDVDNGFKRLMRQGYTLPDGLSVYLADTAKPTTREGQKVDNMQTISFQRDQNCDPAPIVMINFSNTAELNAPIGAATQYTEGRSIEFALIHEMGHIFHERYAGRFFWTPQSVTNDRIPTNPRSETPPNVRLAVSPYSSNNLELAAEVFTKVLINRTENFTPEVWSHYAKIHGAYLPPNYEIEISASLTDAERQLKPLLINQGLDRRARLHLLETAINVIDDYKHIDETTLLRIRIYNYLFEEFTGGGSDQPTTRTIAEQFLAHVLYLVRGSGPPLDGSPLAEDLTTAISSLFYDPPPPSLVVTAPEQ